MFGFKDKQKIKELEEEIKRLKSQQQIVFSPSHDFTGVNSSIIYQINKFTYKIPALKSYIHKLIDAVYETYDDPDEAMKAMTSVINKRFIG